MSIVSAQTSPVCNIFAEQLVSEGEYRALLKDKHSTPEEIQKRVQYIESLCRTIIRTQLQTYANRPKQTEDNV